MYILFDKKISLEIKEEMYNKYTNLLTYLDCDIDYKLLDKLCVDIETYYNQNSTDKGRAI